MTNPLEAANFPTNSKHCWHITTASATYLIDMDGGTIIRIPDTGLGWSDGFPGYSAVLRKDCVPITLLSILECGIGESLVMLLRIRNDGIDTIRTTSEVREMKHV